MATTAITFLAVAITTALIGIYAPKDQGLPEIMFWFTGVSLATAAACALAEIALRRSSEF